MAPPNQTSLSFPCSWGGKRAGAGRPRESARPRVAHVVRPKMTRHEPVHVTLRAHESVERLRRRDGFRAVRWALAVATRRRDFRICSVSIQANHLHLVVEASSPGALARGMQGFAISTAKGLNRLRGRRGSVFADRYHARVLRTPREVRNGLAYVLNNWRKHGEARGATIALDPYASGLGFDGWTTVQDARLGGDQEILPVSFPRSWLLTTGWRRHRAIAPTEVPSAMR
jgi:putative transposase